MRKEYSLIPAIKTSNKEMFDLADKLRREKRITHEQIYMKGVETFLKEFKLTE